MVCKRSSVRTVQNTQAIFSCARIITPPGNIYLVRYIIAPVFFTQYILHLQYSTPLQPRNLKVLYSTVHAVYRIRKVGSFALMYMFLQSYSMCGMMIVRELSHESATTSKVETDHV